MTTLTRVSNEAISFPLSATNPDGTPATVTGAKVALLLARRGPNAATVWTPATFSGGVVTVRLAGPDADPTGATLVVPEYKADLWALPLGITDYNPVKITRITLIGGTGGGPPSSNPYVVSVAGLSGVLTAAALSAALAGPLDAVIAANIADGTSATSAALNAWLTATRSRADFALVDSAIAA